MSDGSSGCGFIMSRAGLYKLLVLAGGCATWAIYIDSRLYRSPKIKTYCLVAYIISFAVSLLLYFFKLIGVALQMESSCLRFSAFDYLWSWLSSINFISSTVIIICFFGDNCDPGCPRSSGFCACAKQLTVVLLGILTAFLYALEAQHLRPYAPCSIGYGTTWRGMWKMIILVVGGTAFGLLIKTGYRCGDGCTEARTFVLVAWVVGWGVAAVFYVFRLINCCANQAADRQVTFGTFEFFWSAFACLLFLVGAAVLAAYLRCNGRFKYGVCRERLAADICGWAAAILFGIDAFFLRNSRPVWFMSNRRVAGSSGRTVVTTTTTRRTK